MKKIFSLLAAVLFAGSMMAEVLVNYTGTTTLPEGVTISGTTVMKNVKTHMNAVGTDAIQFANGYTTDGVFNGNAIILHTEGGFKAGDVLTIAGFFNNSDETKVAKVELFTVNAEGACTAVWTSAQFINGRTTDLDPVEESYTLEADMDSILLGRNGNTGANLTLIKVTREAVPVHESVLVYSFDSSTGDYAGTNNSYAGECDIEIDGLTWALNGNSQMSPWRVGGKSIEATERYLYTKTACANELDSIILRLGLSTLTSLDGIKLIYSANADFSEAAEIVAEIPAALPAAITFVKEGGFAANLYYKFVFTCTVTVTSNKYLQVLGVDFWGKEIEEPAAAIELSVDTEAGIFTITPANDEDIYMFMLLTSEVEGGLSEENAAVLAAEQVSWISADYTLAEFVEEGMAYQGALEAISFELISEGGLADGNYALCAFTVAENDATLHTAEITSEVYYLEFTVGNVPTALQNIEATKAVKMLENGKVVIIRDGVRYNTVGQIVK